MLAPATTGLLSVSFLVISSSLFLVAYVVHAQSSCYRNTTEILVQQTLQVTAEGERNVYTLCPNTIFQLGPSTTPGKQSPLVARSNTLFKCGTDGSSANNCVLSGGESQFWSSETGVFDTDEGAGESGIVATDVVVQGITFQDAQHVAILLEAAGDVTFIDCIIRVSKTTTKTKCESV
jgi:hypothetical protein